MPAVSRRSRRLSHRGRRMRAQGGGRHGGAHGESPHCADAQVGARNASARYPEGTADAAATDTEFAYWVRHYGAQAARGHGRRAPTRGGQRPAPADPRRPEQMHPVHPLRAGLRRGAGRFVWGVAGRGEHAHIVAGADAAMLDARCESCGACVALCPTGALDNRMSLGLGKSDRLVTTTCPYCGVGCNFDLNVKDGKITGSRRIRTLRSTACICA